MLNCIPFANCKFAIQVVWSRFSPIGRTNRPLNFFFKKKNLCFQQLVTLPCYFKKSIKIRAEIQERLSPINEWCEIAAFGRNCPKKKALKVQFRKREKWNQKRLRKQHMDPYLPRAGVPFEPSLGAQLLGDGPQVVLRWGLRGRPDGA